MLPLGGQTVSPESEEGGWLWGELEKPYPIQEGQGGQMGGDSATLLPLLVAVLAQG